ncbi:MAG: OB-fold domain-containing protein, partial [bacterium]|nr:OB-fold domain-containing protein [bacterium]
MIAYLRGVLAEKEITRVVVECHGVGYEAAIPLSTFD